MSQTPIRARRRIRSKANEGTIVKSVTVKGQQPEEAIQRFHGMDVTDPAYISVGGKITKNLGNYESVQIHISVTLPCDPNEKGVRDTKKKASALVEEFINEELESIGQ